MLILATLSQTFHSYFPLFDADHLKIANCSNLTIVLYPLGNFGQTLCIRSCHEDLILTRKSHNCSGIAFIQGDSAGGSTNFNNKVDSKKFSCNFNLAIVSQLSKCLKFMTLRERCFAIRN